MEKDIIAVQGEWNALIASKRDDTIACLIECMKEDKDKDAIMDDIVVLEA